MGKKPSKGDRDSEWSEELSGIEDRLRLRHDLGGIEAITRQHEAGRLTIRERVELMIDAGTFHEQGPLAGYSENDELGNLKSFSPANYILGVAKIDTRPCVVGGEDFTQKGGSPSSAGLRKSIYAESLALRLKIPLVRFLEGGGGSVTGSPGKQGAQGNPVFATPRFRSIAEIMGVAPVVSAAVGAVAGFPAARLVASHFSVMTRNTAQVMIGGPALVERALGKSLTKEELGGAAVHARSGVVDNLVDDENEAADQMRRFLSFMPTNVFQLPPIINSADPPERKAQALRHLVPRDRRKPFKVREILESVLDQGSFFEMTKTFGRSQVTGLGRLNGQPVGVWANDCHFHAGAMTANGAQKVRRFVDLCDTFHLPIISFVDEPGFMIGPEAESAATIRHGASAIFAVQQSQVPWITVLIRKAYGVAAVAHFGPEGVVLAWPSAESGALPLEGGIAVAYRREIAESSNPAAKRKELEEEWAARRSTFGRAEGFAVHDMIDPANTRFELCRWLKWTSPLLEDLRGPSKYEIRP